jgi:predicted MFS family arabinose efflux permease
LPFYLMCWGAAGVAANALIAQLIDRGRRPLRLLCGIIVLVILAFVTLPLAGPVSVLAVLVGYGACFSAQVLSRVKRLRLRVEV